MKRIMRAKNKVTLLFLSAILLLCIGFIFVACGVGPVTKGVNNNRGNFAVDFTDCPGGRTSCTANATTTDKPYNVNTIQGKPLTLEAWIKPKVTTTAFILAHIQSRGAALKVAGIDNSPGPENTTQVTPMFEIRRVVTTVGGGGVTSSVSYTVSGSVIDLNAWTHIAGILTNDVHSVAVHAACTDATGAESDPWHMDIYLNGVYSDCTETYGGTADDTYSDPTAAADAYADAPVAKQVNIQAQGIVDETRIWTVDDRTILDCMNQELGTSGTCDRTDSSLLSYLRFNAGDGHSVMDEAGIFGPAGLVYILTPGDFQSWDTGWTSDTPF